MGALISFVYVVQIHTAHVIIAEHFAVGISMH